MERKNMAIDWNKIDPGFRNTMDLLVKNCATKGVVIVPYYGLRTLEEQAKFWRQSRTKDEVTSAITMLRKEGANFIADAMERVGPCSGPKVTNALPGQSWHNWGFAVDSYVDNHGTAVWDANHVGYRVMAEEAKKLGLEPGFYWKFRDAPHVQLPKEGKPPATWREINQAMREKFQR
jgi:peptidoglycan LD-endopeptidase CwlK